MKFFLNQLFRNQSYEADLFINSSRYFTLTQKKKKQKEMVQEQNQDMKNPREIQDPSGLLCKAEAES